MQSASRVTAANVLTFVGATIDLAGGQWRAQVNNLGLSLLRDPWINKGTAFPKAERERLQIRGLLPPRVTSMAVQVERVMAEFERGRTIIPPEEIVSVRQRLGICAQKQRAHVYTAPD
jgi:hypothetical protein